MANINVFYRLPTKHGTNVTSLPRDACTLEDLCKLVLDTLIKESFIVSYGTKNLRSDDPRLRDVVVRENSHVDFVIAVKGGKGGFGSLLRAIGAQIEKTTNRDACRDLRGRRLRDIKREEELQKLLALQAKLQEEQKRRKKEKLEKLKSKSESYESSRPLQELVAMFDDDDYNKRRLELSDILDAAVEKGIINSHKRHKPDDSDVNDRRACETNDVQDIPDEADDVNNLWLGIEDEE